MNIIGIDEEGNNFKVINGNIPIFLSAPHAVKQIREGKVKSEDALTGAITEYLCINTGANGIIRTCNSNDDPNYENTGKALRYKKKILKCISEKNISILLDIHGCKDCHGFDIELGTNYGENINNNEEILEILRLEFSKIGKVAVDEKFKASKSTTVSNFINKNSGILCVQIEISKKFRRKNEDLIKLLNTFENVIYRLSTKQKIKYCFLK